MNQQEFFEHSRVISPKLAIRQQRACENELRRTVARSPSVYSRHLSQSLQARLDAAAQDHETSHSIEEELDLARDTIIGEAKLYDHACLAHDLAEAAGDVHIMNAALAERITAGARLRCALAGIADMVERAVKIQQSGAELMPTQAMQIVLMQVVRIASEILPEDAAQELADRLRSEVQLPRSAAESVGTLLTPDQDVIDMDATIPMASQERTA